jgi:hypothetical protein
MAVEVSELVHPRCQVIEIEALRQLLLPVAAAAAAAVITATAISVGAEDFWVWLKHHLGPRYRFPPH